MATELKFNPKEYLEVCKLLLDANNDELECFYRTVINRCYLTSVQVAAFHIRMKGIHIPDTSDFYKIVRETIIRIGVHLDVKDDIADLQDMRVKADYRNHITISKSNVNDVMHLAFDVIDTLDSQFPESKL